VVDVSSVEAVVDVNKEDKEVVVVNNVVDAEDANKEVNVEVDVEPVNNVDVRVVANKEDAVVDVK